jgi:hypothetical protein
MKATFRLSFFGFKGSSLRAGLDGRVDSSSITISMAANRAPTFAIGAGSAVLSLVVARSKPPTTPSISPLPCEQPELWVCDPWPPPAPKLFIVGGGSVRRSPTPPSTPRCKVSTTNLFLFSRKLRLFCPVLPAPRPSSVECLYDGGSRVCKVGKARTYTRPCE